MPKAIEAKGASRKKNVFSRFGDRLVRIFRGRIRPISASAGDLTRSKDSSALHNTVILHESAAAGERTACQTPGHADGAADRSHSADSGISTHVSEKSPNCSGLPSAAFREELSRKLRSRPSPDYGPRPIPRSAGSIGSLVSNEAEVTNCSSEHLDPIEVLPYRLDNSTLFSPVVSPTSSTAVTTYTPINPAVQHKLSVGRQRTRRPPTFASRLSRGTPNVKENNDAEQQVEQNGAAAAAVDPFSSIATVTSQLSSSSHLDLIEEEEANTSFSTDIHSSDDAQRSGKLEDNSTDNYKVAAVATNQSADVNQPTHALIFNNSPHTSTPYRKYTANSGSPPCAKISNKPESQEQHHTKLNGVHLRRKAPDVPCTGQQRPLSMFTSRVTPSTLPVVAKGSRTPPVTSIGDSGSSGPISQEELEADTASQYVRSTVRPSNGKDSSEEPSTVAKRASMFGETVQFNRLTSSPSRTSPPLKPSCEQEQDIVCLRTQDPKHEVPAEHRKSRVLDLVKNFETF